MSGIPPYANPRPLPVAPCCNTGCDLKDRAVASAEAFVAAHAEEGDTLSAYLDLKASLRALREWRERR